MGAQGRITDNHLIEIILMGKSFCKGLGGNGAVTVVIIYLTGYLKTVFLFSLARIGLLSGTSGMLLTMATRFKLGGKLTSAGNI